MISIKRCYSNFQRISMILKKEKPGEMIAVKGWIKSVRRMKKNIFLEVNDGSTSKDFQIVVLNNKENRELTLGSSVEVIGCGHISPNGYYEMQAKHISVVAKGQMTGGFPFTPKQQHPAEYVREHLHLRARINYFAAQMRLRHRVFKSIYDFMDTNGFVQINTPVITTNDCEGSGEVFAVKPDNNSLLKIMNRKGIPVEDSYFNKRVYLSVSGQLHLEAMSYGLGNTYTLSPAFRAENSKSPLHLAEFYMLEAELAFINDLEELTSFIEKVIKATTRVILNSSEEDLKICQLNAIGSTDDLTWINDKWSTLSYDDASKIILANKDKLKTPIRLEEGFSKEQELFLVNFCKVPVFVVDWPISQKPFYMKVSRRDAKYVHAVDLLMPAIGELCGGSLRECNLDILSQHPQYPHNLNWYLELRKFGGIPTGGFGMGLERYLQLLTGVKNIRDVIPFPRYPHSCRM